MEKVSWSLAEILVDPGSPGDFNQVRVAINSNIARGRILEY